MGTFLTKGTTFTTGDTVTASGLNNLVDNATVTAGSIGSTELGTNSVTADKISTSAPQPVTTSTIRDNAIDNTKLNNMGSQTVKVNATNGSADPTDLAMIGGGANGTSKILMGTSDSINALTAPQFKMVDVSDVDATDSTATKLELPTAASTEWDAVAAATDVDDDDDRLLIYDDSPTSLLKQISPKKLIQSLPALTTTSGVVRLATTQRAIDPSTVGTVDADVLTVNQSSSMLAKAWCNFTSNIADENDVPAAGQVTAVTSAAFNIAVGDHTTDGTTTTTGGVQQTGVGTYKVYFTTPMPNTNYIVIGNGWHAADSKNAATVGTIVGSKNVAHFTFTTAAETSVFPNVAYFQLMVFGLGS